MDMLANQSDRMAALRVKLDELNDLLMRTIGKGPRNSVIARIVAVETELDSLKNEAIRRVQAEGRERILTLTAGQPVPEEQSFWFRRFFTTVGLANAGGIVTLATLVAQAKDRSGVADHVVLAMELFFAGAMAAGVLPLIFAFSTSSEMMLKRRPSLGFWELAWARIAVAISVGSAMCFGAGMLIVIGFFRGL